MKLMEKTDAQVESQEEELSTDSEEEKQQMQINAANASLVWDKKFYVIPDYLISLTKYEMLIMAFILSFSVQKKKRFYFSNEQLAKKLQTTVKTISTSLTNLKKKGFLDLDYKVKANGGQIRFVNLQPQFEARLEETSRCNWKKLPQSNKNISNIYNIYTTKEKEIKKKKKIIYQKSKEDYFLNTDLDKEEKLVDFTKRLVELYEQTWKTKIRKPEKYMPMVKKALEKGHTPSDLGAAITKAYESDYYSGRAPNAWKNCDLTWILTITSGRDNILKLSNLQTNKKTYLR